MFASERRLEGFHSLIPGLLIYEGFWVLMNCIVDASRGGQGLHAVAAVLFTPDNLAAFENEWSAECAALPKPLSTGECVSGYGQIPWARRFEWLEKIARLVAKYRGPSFVCMLSEEDFAKWEAFAPQNRAWIDNPYSACLVGVLDMVREVLKNEPAVKLEYLIEEGDAGQPHARKIVRRIWDDEHRLRKVYRCYSEPRYIPKTQKSTFVAADFIAWGCRKNEEEVAAVGFDKDLEWRTFYRLLNDGPPITQVVMTDLTLRKRALYYSMASLDH